MAELRHSAQYGLAYLLERLDHEEPGVLWLEVERLWVICNVLIHGRGALPRRHPRLGLARSRRRLLGLLRRPPVRVHLGLRP